MRASDIGTWELLLTRAQQYDLAAAEHDFPLWEGPPRRSIVICSHPRSGSTLLGEALYFAGGLGCPLEYFHIGCRPGFEARWRTETSRAYVDAVWRHRTDSGGTLSVKLLWPDVEALALEFGPTRLAGLAGAEPEAVAPGTYRLLAELLGSIMPGAEWVHLHRRDRLRQAISASIARQTNQWRSIPGAEALAQAEPVFDPDTIGRLIGYADRCHRHWRNLFAALASEPLTIAYEELTENYDASVRRLLASLGSNAPVPPPRMRRQADKRSEAFILRYLRERAR